MSSSGSGEQRSAPAEQHLGDRLAAFVDGELTDDSRDRVLAHLATCPQCKAAAAEQRRLKSVVAASELPAISADLLARLQGLPGMDGGPGDDGGSPDGHDRRTEAGARSSGPRPGFGSHSGPSGPDAGAGPGSESDSRLGSGGWRGPFDGGLLGSGVFGGGRRAEFSYLSPGRDLVAPADSRARGFRIHELARAAAATAAADGGAPGGAGPAGASRGRRFAFAAAGAFSMAAIAIGGALPMEAISGGAARPDEGPAVSPFNANSVSDTRGAIPRQALDAPADEPPVATPAPGGVASATSVSLTRPLLTPGAVPLMDSAGTAVASASSSFVLH
ncbi:zf-HC2 domain-containing protein [Streptomyces sp.]|uniref:zf-HC2 domain-containing protein n=1 Tax=Streptomyces sp. TaxID=1931 RepID=UPI002F428505